MIVSNCIQDEKMNAIKCYTVDYFDSLCMCSRSVKILNQKYERIRNTNLYHVDFIGNFEDQKSFFASKKESGLYDCLVKSKQAIWMCSAYKSKLYRSACSCYDSKYEFFYVGSIPTDELFQNVNSSQLRRSNITNIDDIISPYVHFDEENDGLNEYKKTNFHLSGYNFIDFNSYLFVALIQILMLLIIIVLRKQLRRGIRLKNYSKFHPKNIFA